jgi:hypothetical protein
MSKAEPLVGDASGSGSDLPLIEGLHANLQFTTTFCCPGQACSDLYPIWTIEDTGLAEIHGPGTKVRLNVR